MEPGTVVYEHEEFGLATVQFRWEDGEFGQVWTPFCVEFDLFTPVSESEALTRELDCVRVDRSGSVSAQESEARDGASL